MTSSKYLNCVLSVIAFCLIMITLAVTGLLPSASAKKSYTSGYLNVPINKDGSLNVKLINNTIDVNVDEVGGSSVNGTLPMNIEEVDGFSIRGHNVPVEIEK